VRYLTVLILSLLVASGTLDAQTTQISARGGLLRYDAGNDNSFPLLQMAFEQRVGPHLRLGVVGSWSHVGQVAKPWIARGSNETLLRGAVTAGYEATNLFAHVPLIRGVTPVFSAGLGVVHSAGVQTDFSEYQNDPFFGITDQRTGLSYGGGLTLERPVTSHALITASVLVWRDKLYGGRLYNFDQVLGVAWRF